MPHVLMLLMMMVLELMPALMIMVALIAFLPVVAHHVTEVTSVAICTAATC
jgi:hypothetical protein